MVTLPERFAVARGVLRHYYGFGEFRPWQRRVLQSVFLGRDTLAVLPTGGGKSLCYQIPAVMLRGLTIVVSPLIALMQDQVAAARSRGIPVAALTSAMSWSSREATLSAVRRGEVRLLYLAPERLAPVVERLRAGGPRCELLAVDEAHCISEWGHDFRPAYRRIRQRCARLSFPPVVALTGSATPGVRRDIIASLGMGRHRALDSHVASFDRPNLSFAAVRVRSEAGRLDELVDRVRGSPATSLVYVPTRSVCEALSRALNRAGIRTRPYHAGLSAGARRRVLEQFLDDRVAAVVATSAFGMGIDKPDVALVIHWLLPATPEAYYQEAGRAGRNGAPARVILMYRPGDERFHRQQLSVTFPRRSLVARAAGGGDLPGLPASVRDSALRLARELSAGGEGPGGWRLVRRRHRAARRRLAAMVHYARTRSCRRRMLLRYFGEQGCPCGGCDGHRCTVAG